MQENKKNKKKQPKRFIVLIGVASQMGITIFLGATLGKFLDTKYQMEKRQITQMCNIDTPSHRSWVCLKIKGFIFCRTKKLFFRFLQ